MRLIPGEAVGLYLVGSGFIPAGTAFESAALAGWGVVCLFAVIVVRSYGSSYPSAGLGPQWSSIIIASLAFVVWVYSIGGPFAAYHIYVPWVGSLLVIAITFFAPYFYKGS